MLSVAYNPFMLCRDAECDYDDIVMLNVVKLSGS